MNLIARSWRETYCGSASTKHRASDVQASCRIWAAPLDTGVGAAAVLPIVKLWEVVEAVAVVGCLELGDSWSMVVML